MLYLVIALYVQQWGQTEEFLASFWFEGYSFWPYTMQGYWYAEFDQLYILPVFIIHSLCYCMCRGWLGEAGQGRGRGQEGQKSGKGKGRGPRHQKGPRMRQRERPRRTRQRESPRQRWITGDEPVTDSWSEFVVEEDHLNSMKPFIGAYVPSNTTKHQQSWLLPTAAQSGAFLPDCRGDEQVCIVQRSINVQSLTLKLQPLSSSVLQWEL